MTEVDFMKTYVGGRVLVHIGGHKHIARVVRKNNTTRQLTLLCILQDSTTREIQRHRRACSLAHPNAPVGPLDDLVSEYSVPVFGQQTEQLKNHEHSGDVHVTKD